MSTDHELRHAAAALAADADTATQALISTLTAAPDPMPGINARATALRAENDRRARAGVRVVTPDGFDARHIAMLTDAYAATEARAQTFARGATDLAALLTRSLALLAQMGDALAAPERAAAEAARVAERAAAEAARIDAALLKQRTQDHEASMRDRRAAQCAEDRRAS